MTDIETTLDRVRDSKISLESLEDWDFIPPCEAEYNDGSTCDNEANWVTRPSCCTMISLMCESCVEEFERFCTTNAGMKFHCGKCDSSQILAPGHLKIIKRV